MTGNSRPDSDQLPNLMTRLDAAVVQLGCVEGRALPSLKGTTTVGFEDRADDRS